MEIGSTGCHKKNTHLKCHKTKTILKKIWMFAGNGIFKENGGEESGILKIWMFQVNGVKICTSIWILKENGFFMTKNKRSFIFCGALI